MKLDVRDDFTGLPRAGSFIRAAEAGAGPPPVAVAVLAHDERHLRRRAIALSGGGRVLVDLPEPAALDHGDLLVLDDGRRVGIAAAEEEVYEVGARSALHLAELAWHIGNRHLAAEIGENRILIPRDRVVGAMLEGLGATVREARGRFAPLRGAYSGHSHGHHHR